MEKGKTIHSLVIRFTRIIILPESALFFIVFNSPYQVPFSILLCKLKIENYNLIYKPPEGYPQLFRLTFLIQKIHFTFNL